LFQNRDRWKAGVDRVIVIWDQWQDGVDWGKVIWFRTGTSDRIVWTG